MGQQQGVGDLRHGVGPLAQQQPQPPPLVPAVGRRVVQLVMRQLAGPAERPAGQIAAVQVAQRLGAAAPEQPGDGLVGQAVAAEGIDHRAQGAGDAAGDQFPVSHAPARRDLAWQVAVAGPVLNLPIGRADLGDGPVQFRPAGVAGQIEAVFHELQGHAAGFETRQAIAAIGVAAEDQFRGRRHDHIAGPQPQPERLAFQAFQPRRVARLHPVAAPGRRPVAGAVAHPGPAGVALLTFGRPGGVAAVGPVHDVRHGFSRRG